MDPLFHLQTTNVCLVWIVDSVANRAFDMAAKKYLLDEPLHHPCLLGLGQCKTYKHVECKICIWLHPY